MAGSTISTNITHSVTLGVGGYTSPLKITRTGEVKSSAGVYAELSHSKIVNDGNILASSGWGVYLGTDTVTPAPGGTLINQGSISGGNSSGGVFLGKGNAATNFGTVSDAGADGIFMYGSSLKNAGEISGGIFGVAQNAFGTITNSGSISAGYEGVFMSGGTLLNSGEISVAGPNASIGVDLFLSTGTNTKSGDISGNSEGIYLKYHSDFSNAGKITGFFGAFADSGTTLSNSGSIRGAEIGVSLQNATLTNSGRISGGEYAVRGENSVLIVDPGAVFQADVYVVDGSLALAGRAAGTLDGIGSKFTGFADFTFESGSEWTLSGNKAGLTARQEINGFAAGDTIILDGFAAKSDTFVSGVGLVLARGKDTVTLDLTGSLKTADFSVSYGGNRTTIGFAAKPGPDQAVALDSEMSKAEMGFLSPTNAVASSSSEHALYGSAGWFTDIRSAKYAAAYSKGARMESITPLSAVTFSGGHGFGPVSIGLTDLSAQHDARIAAIPVTL